MEEIIKTNKCQTPITEEFLSNYPDEIREQFMEIISTVPFIQNLISPSRPHIKDLPRDEKGRAIIDLSNPPIFEDADYFRQAALYFMNEGVYTKLRPNSNPNSEYRRFWDRELDRCYNGLLRNSDGMWIPGYMYWFLNYCPMMINEYKEGKKKAIRKEGFGYFFEGIWWRYIYLNKARENGHHAVELAKRGAGKAHPYNTKVYTPTGIKYWKDIKIGDELFGDDGNITKVIDIPFDDVAPIYELTLKDGRKVRASEGHLWKVNRGNKEIVLSTKELLEVYKSKRSISERNPKGVEYKYSITANKGVEYPMQETKIDPYTFGLLLGDGCFRHPCCYFTCEDSDFNDIKNYIPYNIKKWNIKYSYNVLIPQWNNILDSYNLNNKKSKDKFIPDEYKYNTRNVRLEILKGLMDSDGTIGNKGVQEIALSSYKLIKDIEFIVRSLGFNCRIFKKENTGYYNKKGEYIKCLPSYRLAIYTDIPLFKLKRKADKVKEKTSEYSKSNMVKTRIVDIKYVGDELCKCVSVDNNSKCYLIEDFITTHNSYGLAAIMSHNLVIGESEESRRRCITVLTAYQKEYLKDDKDGTLSKFVPIISFLSKYTPFPKLMLKQSSNEMTWQMGYKDEYGRNQGSLNQVMGVSAKDDSDKLRGKRGWILYEEFGNFNGLLELYDVTRKSVEDGDYTFACMYLIGCVCANTKVWTSDGRNINIEDLYKEDGIIGFTKKIDLEDVHLNRGLTIEPIVSDIIKGPKECVRITLANGNTLECSKDHPIAIQKGKYTHEKFLGYEELFRKAENIKIGDRVLEAREISIFGKDTLFDARLVGMLIGDGTYGSSVKYSSEDLELQDYIKNKYECKVFRSHITKTGKVYEEFRVNGIRGLLNDIGILGQTKQDKRLPINYQTLNKENTIELLSGLYDTDGCIHLGHKNGFINITQANKEILEEIKILWRKFGVIGSIIKTNPTIREDRKDKNPWYTLVISGRFNCLRACKVLQLLVPYKRDNLITVENFYINNPSKKSQKYPTDIIMSKVVKVEDIGIKDVYNLTAGLSHTYLANNIITHNTANNKEANFQSAKTLLYAPHSYNIQEIINLYDKKGQGKDTFGFFFPSYINRAGCYNKDGISDVVKAILQVLTNRYKAKYGADPTSVLRVIAEDPITPAEAIIKVKDAYFNVQALNERAQQLDTNPSIYNDVYIGQLITNNKGDIEFKPTSDTPIRKFPVDNSNKGALEIYSMPEKDSNGNVFNNRYIIGHDPVDNDSADSSSLSSTFVFDLFTDTIVAEFTGRNAYADDNFEVVRLLCLFYNAKVLYESNKKGIFAYFQSKKCVYLLAETPEYLRDKQLVKYSSFGSNAYGVNASAAINIYANRLLKDWFNKTITVLQKNDKGEEIEVSIPMIYSLKTRALIEEAIQFNPEINVDRIRSMGMVMIYRQEFIIKYGGELNKESREVSSRDYLGNDKFFTRNYEDRLYMQ